MKPVDTVCPICDKSFQVTNPVAVDNLFQGIRVVCESCEQPCPVRFVDDEGGVDFLNCSPDDWDWVRKVLENLFFENKVSFREVSNLLGCLNG